MDRLVSTASVPKPVRLLLVEDDAHDARIVGQLLQDRQDFRLHHQTTLERALNQLRAVEFDAILLDLRLPDAQGLDTLSAIRHAAPRTAIVVHSGVADDKLARDTIRRGAQECLLKGEADSDLMARSIHHAIIRSRLEQRRHPLQDELTRLPSRVLLEDRLKQATASAARSGQWLAVLKIELIGLGTILEQLGPTSGDRLVIGAARKIVRCLRASDTTSRVSVDQFVVVTEGLSRQEDVNGIAQRIVRSFRRPFRIDGHEIEAAARIGISLYPHDATAPGALLKTAELALRRAAAEPENAYRFYRPARNCRNRDGDVLGRVLRDALANGELCLHYQPHLDLPSGCLSGAEALLRWHHPGGWVPPSRFIPVAEETGLIFPIGEWVLRFACKQNVAWQEQGLRSLPVGVNLSARQLLADDLETTVSGVLRETSLDPEYLEVEVTERAIFLNEDRARSNLLKLHRLGIHITVDDFGAGEFSAAHLRRLPVDNVKIDRSLVCRVDDEDRGAELVAGLISIAHGLDFEVTAKGVENAAQFVFLRNAGCERMQGFYIRQPEPAAKLTSFLRQTPSEQMKLPVSHTDLVQ